MSDEERKPVAWLIREVFKHGWRPRVVCGRMFVHEGTAKVAAKRMTSYRRTYEAFPVYADE